MTEGVKTTIKMYSKRKILIFYTLIFFVCFLFISNLIFIFGTVAYGYSSESYDKEFSELIQKNSELSKKYHNEKNRATSEDSLNSYHYDKLTYFSSEKKEVTAFLEKRENF